MSSAVDNLQEVVPAVEKVVVEEEAAIPELIAKSAEDLLREEVEALKLVIYAQKVALAQSIDVESLNEAQCAQIKSRVTYYKSYNAAVAKASHSAQQ